MASILTGNASTCLCWNSVVYMQDVAGVPELGGNGIFNAITLPANSSEVVILPRWNIIALAKRPAVLSVKDVSQIPEITPPKPKTVRPAICISCHITCASSESCCNEHYLFLYLAHWPCLRALAFACRSRK